MQDYWLSDAAEKQDSKPKFRQIGLSLNKLVGLCYATDEVLQDANALEITILWNLWKKLLFKLTMQSLMVVVPVNDLA